MKPKQIIIDKSAFDGININDICKFANNHILLACDTLLYECATTCNSKRKEKLSCYKRLIESGAYFCHCSITYVQYEGRYSQPYPCFLPDLNVTEQIRKGKDWLEEVLDSPNIGLIFQTRWKVAKDMFIELSDKIKNRIDKERPDVGKKIKDIPLDKLDRFKFYFDGIDERYLQQTCVNSFPSNWINDKLKFSLSPEWMSWQYVRLIGVIVQEYHCLRQMSGVPSEKTAEHDYQDMEYILLLSRADILLTRDENLVKPLAKAAFPEKDVFSSLDEVPEDYKCNWIQ